MKNLGQLRWMMMHEVKGSDGWWMNNKFLQLGGLKSRKKLQKEIK